MIFCVPQGLSSPLLCLFHLQHTQLVLQAQTSSIPHLLLSFMVTPPSWHLQNDGISTSARAVPTLMASWSLCRDSNLATWCQASLFSMTLSILGPPMQLRLHLHQCLLLSFDNTKSYLLSITS